MSTMVNNAGLTTDTPVYRISVNGPFHKRPSGRFNRRGEPIMRRCNPYWIVRCAFGRTGSILQDREFASAAAAQAWYESLMPYESPVS